MRRVSRAALGVVAITAACSKTPEPDATSSAKPAGTAAHAPTGAAAKPAPGVNEIAWDTPPAWQKADNPSTMRLLTYKIPRAAGDPEDAELSISRAGGTVQMNIDRWSGQFQTKKPDATQRQEREVGGLKVTTVEIHGTFSGSGMPGASGGAPKSDWALLGAIVEAGSAPYFFKMTGPDKTVTSAKPDFEKLVLSFRPK